MAGQEVAQGKATFGAPMVFARLGRIAPVSLDRAEERIRTATVHAAYVRSRFNKPEDTRKLATHANVGRKLQYERERGSGGEVIVE